MVRRDGKRDDLQATIQQALQKNWKHEPSVGSDQNSEAMS